MKPSSAIHDSAVDTLCEVFLDRGYVPIREGTLMNIESGWWWLDKTLPPKSQQKKGELCGRHLQFFSLNIEGELLGFVMCEDS
jgi:hypothetical protein